MSGSYLLLLGYLFALHVAPVLNMCGLISGGRIAVIVDSASGFVWVLAAAWLFGRRNGGKLSPLDLCVLLYLAMNLLSLVLYFQPAAPSHWYAYFYGLHYVVVPMGGYFAVQALPAFRRAKLVGWMIALNLALFATGILLQFIRPDFYTEHLAERLYAGYYTEYWQYYYRLSSYLNSTSVGTLCAVTLVLFGLTPRYKRWLLLCLPLIFVTVALSRQRGGMATSLLALGYLVMLTRLSRWLKFVSVALMCVGGIVALTLLSQQHVGSTYALGNRFTVEMMDVLEGRGYGPGWTYFVRFPLGAGVGASLSATDAAGLATLGQVVDANFMRVLADLGILGLLALLAVWIAAIRMASLADHFWGWLTLLGIVAIICIGTNTLDAFYISQSFWLLLGVMNATAVGMQHRQLNPDSRDPATLSSKQLTRVGPAES